MIRIEKMLFLKVLFFFFFQLWSDTFKEHIPTQEFTTYVCPCVLQSLPHMRGHIPHAHKKWQEQRKPAASARLSKSPASGMKLCTLQDVGLEYILL